MYVSTYLSIYFFLFQPTLTEECHIYLENDTTNEIDQLYRKGLPSDKINVKKCPLRFKKQYRKKRPYRLYIGIHSRGRIMRACRAGPYCSKRHGTSSPKSSRFQIVWEATTPPAIRPTDNPGPVCPFNNLTSKDTNHTMILPTGPSATLGAIRLSPFDDLPRAIKPETKMDAENPFKASKPFKHKRPSRRPSKRPSGRRNSRKGVRAQVRKWGRGKPLTHWK